MDDKAIIALYFSRSEQAITETKSKYERLCMKIANGILQTHLQIIRPSLFIWKTERITVIYHHTIPIIREVQCWVWEQWGYQEILLLLQGF